MFCEKCLKMHAYPHDNGCQFCEETRPHHHLWGAFGQKTILDCPYEGAEAKVDE